jgi:uncharacterized damage-inducible protein DinB
MRELLAMLDAAYDRPSWHGTNLRGSIRGVPPEMAAWRPGRGRHNVWELVVHAAYWKYIGLRRLTGAARGSFPLRGSNWFARPEAHTASAWRADVALLDASHCALREAVVKLPAGEIHTAPRGSKWSDFALLSGIAAHDLYHAGQIQLLKRLYRDRHPAAGRRTSRAHT